MARHAKYHAPRKTSLILEQRNLDWLQRQAEHHRSSVSAEVNRLVEQAMSTPRSAPPSLHSRIRSLIEEGRLEAARTLLAELPGCSDLEPLRRVLSPPSVSAADQPRVDLAADLAWLAEHAADHRGRWVAVDGGTLVAEAGTLPALLERIERASPSSRALIHRVTGP